MKLNMNVEHIDLEWPWMLDVQNFCTMWFPSHASSLNLCTCKWVENLFLSCFQKHLSVIVEKVFQTCRHVISVQKGDYFFFLELMKKKWNLWDLLLLYSFSSKKKLLDEVYAKNFRRLRGSRLAQQESSGNWKLKRFSKWHWS